MKKETSLSPSLLMRVFRFVSNNRLLIAFMGLSLFVNTACNDDESDVNPPTGVTSVTGYQQVNLVSDTAGYGSTNIDTLLVNAWGIAQDPSGNFWIAATEENVSVIYNDKGVTQMPAVTVDSSNPTGIVYNMTTDFMIPSSGEFSKYIFAGESGMIYAWASGDSAKLVVDNSATGAVYKGVTIAADGANNFLYAADFNGGKIDVYDANFNKITSKPFSDPSIPAGFAPFNVESINGKLYVTYAKQLAPDNEDDEKGPGNGYVNIFNPNGVLVKRFASQGELNSPWAVAVAPSGFGQFSNAILIGNFGSGRINAYDANGVLLGQVNDNGTPITIDGLWGIIFPKNLAPGSQNTLYFTAGPKDESHGLFGYIRTR